MGVTLTEVIGAVVVADKTFRVVYVYGACVDTSLPPPPAEWVTVTSHCMGINIHVAQAPGTPYLPTCYPLPAKENTHPAAEYFGRAFLRALDRAQDRARHYTLSLEDALRDITTMVETGETPDEPLHGGAPVMHDAYTAVIEYVKKHRPTPVPEGVRKDLIRAIPGLIDPTSPIRPVREAFLHTDPPDNLADHVLRLLDAIEATRTTNPPIAAALIARVVDLLCA